MSALSKGLMTADEFLAWAQTQPKEAGRYELYDGHIVRLQDARYQHSTAKFNLGYALRRALETSGLAYRA
jgi:Uma2 family endonuclease